MFNHMKPPCFSLKIRLLFIDFVGSSLGSGSETFISVQDRIRIRPKVSGASGSGSGSTTLQSEPLLRMRNLAWWIIALSRRPAARQVPDLIYGRISQRQFCETRTVTFCLSGTGTVIKWNHKSSHRHSIKLRTGIWFPSFNIFFIHILQ
jgi:hypothetical protein